MFTSAGREVTDGLYSSADSGSHVDVRNGLSWMHVDVVVIHLGVGRHDRFELVQ